MPAHRHCLVFPQTVQESTLAASLQALQIAYSKSGKETHAIALGRKILQMEDRAAVARDRTEVLSLEMVHHDERLFVVVHADVVHLRDVLALQAYRPAGLATKARDRACSATR